MHDPATVAEVLALRKDGLGARRISSRTGVPVSTVRDWLAGSLPRHSSVETRAPSRGCASCGGKAHDFSRLPREYVYLLGLYLGDGCISAHPRGVYRLRICLDLRYPGIIESCVAAVRAVAPANRVQVLPRSGEFSPGDAPSNVEVSAYSKAWPCLFPQHGPGRKHERRIELAPWQTALIDESPEQSLRGLIHSDGCRFINTGRAGWAAPRYSFRNRSADIRRMFCEACDVAGLHWTASGRSDRDGTIYVSRKADVAWLDRFVGPKA